MDKAFDMGEFSRRGETMLWEGEKAGQNFATACADEAFCKKSARSQSAKLAELARYARGRLACDDFSGAASSGSAGVTGPTVPPPLPDAAETLPIRRLVVEDRFKVKWSGQGISVRVPKTLGSASGQIAKWAFGKGTWKYTVGLCFIMFLAPSLIGAVLIAIINFCIYLITGILSCGVLAFGGHVHNSLSFIETALQAVVVVIDERLHFFISGVTGKICTWTGLSLYAQPPATLQDNSRFACLSALEFSAVGFLLFRHFRPVPQAARIV